MIAHTLLLSLSVAACLCKNKKDAESHTPAAPKLNKITAVGGPPYVISVEWEPIEFYDRSPNSGYKVKLWKSAKVPVLFKVGNVWNKKYISEQSLHDMPRSAPVEHIVGVYQTTAVFEGIILEADYQVRVQAFEQLRHGRYSNVLGIKLRSPRKYKEKKQKFTSSSQKHNRVV